jgi:hypothetical protein
MTFFKAFLQGMKVTIHGKAFNGGYLTAIGLHGEYGATFGGFAIKMNGAGAAAACVAANMGAGKAQHIAQVLHQQQPGFYLVPEVLTIYCN